MRVIKLNSRRQRLAVGIASFLLSSSAMACGGVFDVACNLQNGGMSPENLGRQGEIIVQDAGNTVQKECRERTTSQLIDWSDPRASHTGFAGHGNQWLCSYTGLHPAAADRVRVGGFHESGQIQDRG